MPWPDGLEYAASAVNLANGRGAVLHFGGYTYPSRYTAGYPLILDFFQSLLRRRFSAPQRLGRSRHALGLRHLHADARAVLAPGRDDCGADARAVAGVHHVFVARDERRANIVRDDLRGSDAGGSNVGLRHSIIKLDANGGMADVRSRWPGSRRSSVPPMRQSSPAWRCAL